MLKHPRRPKVPGLALAWMLLPSASGLARAEDQMITDRPDFAESSEVVGRGRFQVETSLAYERDRGERLRSTPTLLRFGLSDRWELRLETEGLLRQREDGRTVSGSADPSLGLKWHLQGGRGDDDDDDEHGGGGRGPSMALLLHAELDTGSSAFRGRGVRPSLRMVSEWELGGGWSVGAMPGIQLDRDAQGRRYAWGMFSVLVERQLTPAIGVIAELAAKRLAANRHGGNAYSFDPSATWRLGRDAQLDIGVDLGLNRNTPRSIFALGVSMRF